MSQAALAIAGQLPFPLSRRGVVALASSGVGCIGVVDFLTGYALSVSEFYLAPVALAAWYVSLRASVLIALFSCICWVLADTLAGLPYGQPAILIWNTIVQFSFLIVNGLLVVKLRNSLIHERQLARTDSLTGAFTRRAFEDRLDHDLQLAQRTGTPLTIALVDLDNFKMLNDTRGHAAGDQALRAIALALRGATRSPDTVGRLGGDEFALVLPDTSRPGAEELIERLRYDLVRQLAPVAPELTCSIGVITFEVLPLDTRGILHAADTLMYDAKRKGKNTVVFNVVGRERRSIIPPADTTSGSRSARSREAVPVYPIVR